MGRDEAENKNKEGKTIKWMDTRIQRRKRKKYYK
jgi:hypothetical protein